MKKKFVIILLAVTGTALYFNPADKTPETGGRKAEEAKRQEGGLAPLSSALPSYKKKLQETTSPGEIRELGEVRENFREQLTQLKEVTAAYNQKVMEKKLTPQDEEDYQAAARASLLAYEEYKKTFINLNHEI